MHSDSALTLRPLPLGYTDGILILQNQCICVADGPAGPLFCTKPDGRGLSSVSPSGTSRSPALRTRWRPLRPVAYEADLAKPQSPGCRSWSRDPRPRRAVGMRILGGADGRQLEKLGFWVVRMVDS